MPPRQLDHAPWHGLVGLRDEEVELADRDPLEALQTVLEEVDDRRVVDPASDLAAPAVGAEARQDEFRRGGVERAGAGVAGARHQRPCKARPLQNGDGIAGGQPFGRVVAEMDMGVEDRHRRAVGTGCRGQQRRGGGRGCEKATARNHGGSPSRWRIRTLSLPAAAWQARGSLRRRGVPGAVRRYRPDPVQSGHRSPDRQGNGAHRVARPNSVRLDRLLHRVRDGAEPRFPKSAAVAEQLTGIRMPCGAALVRSAMSVPALASCRTPVRTNAYPRLPLTCATSVPAARGGPPRVPPPSTTSVWPVM